MRLIPCRRQKAPIFTGIARSPLNPLLAVALASLLFISGTGLASAFENENGLWALASVTGAFPRQTDLPAWRWSGESQYRALDDDASINQILLRAGIGYAMESRLSIWGGYAYVRTDSSDISSIDEHRLWQDLRLPPFAIASLKINIRSRLEERWLDGSEDTGWRFRQRVSAEWSRSPDTNYSIIASEELFVSLNDTNWGENSGFDQNRFFFGLGYRFNAGQLQLGYLNQFVDRQLDSDLMNHSLFIGLALRP